MLLRLKTVAYLSYLMELVEVIVLLIADQITEFIPQSFEEMFIANEVLHLTTSEWSIQQLQSTLCNTAHNTIIMLDVILLFQSILHSSSVIIYYCMQ